MTSQSNPTALSAVAPSVIADDASSGGGDSPLSRTDPDRWYFPKERLEITPSRRSGIDPDKELTYRQQSANFIQDIGQRLQVNQLCINTAIVYMHRFYMFHSFTHFHRNAISAASIFLAAKVEEQPRKLEHVIKVAHYCLHREHQPQIDAKSEQYLEQSAELVMNENILLQTLGFDVAIDHPHTHVVKCCQLVRASKDLAQTSYFMATNSLHLTTMCLQYKPTVVACVCIHLACKWSSWEIPRSKEGKDWFWYVDDTVTSELLEKLTTDFLQVFNKSPSRLKKKIISLNNAASSSSLSLTSMPYHGFDSSPGQHHQSRSRSPSPKRLVKPSNSQPVVPGKPKPHGMPMPHHPGMKVPYPPGAPGRDGKHSSSHMSSHPPHGHPSGSKPPHPGMPPGSMKDPHHPHHPPPHGKAPYPPHGHSQHGHGQYPHGSRPGMQSSGSSQSHHGHGIHSKPPVSGSSSSSHQSHPYSSSAMKNMQAHPSKPPHMPPSGAPKMPPNQVPGAVKNPSQPMFHSSQSQHLKKPYEARDFGLSKREGATAGNVHHSQNHARPHEKLQDGRHHPPGMPGTHSSSSQSSSSESRDNQIPSYLGNMDGSGGSGSSSNQKMAYMESRSTHGSDMNRHRMPPSTDPNKRGLSHGSSSATNGNNNDNMSSLGSAGGSSSGAGDSHVPSKNAYRASQPPSSTFGQNSQMESGASKYQGDGFGGDFGSVFGSSGSTSASNVMSIEDRRKKRLAEGMAMGSAAKRLKTNDPYVPSVPISTNSLFSPEEIAESSKRGNVPTSQFSPSALEKPQHSYSKVPERSHVGAGNAYKGTSSSEGIVFGSSTNKPDNIRSSSSSSSSKINTLMESKAPSLHPFNESKGDSSLSSGTGNGPPPRAVSLFSPEFTPSTTLSPILSISPPPPTTIPDIHSKRDSLFSNLRQEVVDVKSKPPHVPSRQVEGGGGGSSQSSLTGRLSSSPKREDGDDSHSKKSKKSKKEKHKHKHKDEKKHKKDKNKDKEKEKEKEKKEKHRSKDKHSSSGSSAPAEVTNDVMSSHKIKIKLPRADDSKSASVQSATASRATTRQSSKNSSSPMLAVDATTLPGLKVKISSKGRISSVDDDVRHGGIGGGASPGDVDTPCCPGFGPCLTCNRDTAQDQYRFFSSAPVQGLTMKFAKSKESSKSSKEYTSSSSSKDSKKSKEKTSKSSSSSSASAGYNSSMPMLSSGARLPTMPSSHHMHKNGMEKSSKKKDKSAA